MKYPKHNDLICPNFIFGSHDDFSIILDLYVGYDNDFNLVILCEQTNYERPDSICALCAIVEKEEAYKLSRKLNVSMNDLPREISNAMSHYEKINCPEPSDVRDCFREITECIVEEGCKFKMIKTP